MSQVVAKQSAEPEVAVVLCTYNGVRYLQEQVESLFAQDYPLFIVASDDVSTDGTAELLSALLRPEIDSLVRQPKNLGYVRNFETTLNRALDAGAAYFALSDQDDIWDKGRIACGMRKMAELESRYGEDVPLLVHSDLQLIDADGQLLHESFLAYRRYRITSERNLAIILGENGVMGNTVLMNKAMASLCRAFPEQLHVHDYWIALLAELFGRRAMLEIPGVGYRLHTDNASNTAHSMRKGYRAVLSNTTWGKLWSRNFKLPYKEDSRLLTLNSLLDRAETFSALDVHDWRQIEAFRHYLIFKQSRLRSFIYLLRSNMVRKGFFFKLRLFTLIMLTRRYPR